MCNDQLRFMLNLAPDLELTSNRPFYRGYFDLFNIRKIWLPSLSVPVSHDGVTASETESFIMFFQLWHVKMCSAKKKAYEVSARDKGDNSCECVNDIQEILVIYSSVSIKLVICFCLWLLITIFSTFV